MSVEPLEALGARVAELERVHAAGDADRVLIFGETCGCIRRSTSTVTRWNRSAVLRAKYRLDLLLTKDVTGRWTSTPRRIAMWQRAVAAKWGGR